MDKLPLNIVGLGLILAGILFMYFLSFVGIIIGLIMIIGLGLLVAGVIFMIMGGLVGWIIGVICVIGGIGALFMTWQRKRRATA